MRSPDPGAGSSRSTETGTSRLLPGGLIQALRMVILAPGSAVVGFRVTPHSRPTTPLSASRTSVWSRG